MAGITVIGNRRIVGICPLFYTCKIIKINNGLYDSIKEYLYPQPSRLDFSAFLNYNPDIDRVICALSAGAKAPREADGNSALSQ